MKKILIYGINYSPDLIGIARYTAELAEYLAANGFEVRVITAPPYYPAWKISAGYVGWKYQKGVVNGVTIFRTPLWVPSHPSGLKRLVHLLSFAASSIPSVLMQWRWGPDAILQIEPPLFCAPTTLFLGKLSGAKTWLHIQDFEVDAAFQMGLLPYPRLRKLVERVERAILRRFSRVSSISKKMLDLARKKGVKEERLYFLPNWVESSKFPIPAGGAGYRKEIGISADQIVALYSGNMGGKQGLEILADCARIFSTSCLDFDVRFVFCGNGFGRSELEGRCSDLPNVHFLDLQPAERLGELLEFADIHLLPQRADAADLVMPSKLTGMMSSGRPVVATASPDTEVGSVISLEANCGLLAAPGDVGEFAEAVLKLAKDRGLRKSLGDNGKMYAKKFLDRRAILEKFSQNILN